VFSLLSASVPPRGWVRAGAIVWRGRHRQNSFPIHLHIVSFSVVRMWALGLYNLRFGRAEGCSGFVAVRAPPEAFPGGAAVLVSHSCPSCSGSVDQSQLIVFCLLGTAG